MKVMLTVGKKTAEYEAVDTLMLNSTLYIALQPDTEPFKIYSVKG